MATAFVAGATGFTGREVVRALVERGAKTVAHVRPDSSRLGEWREWIESMGARADTTPWDEGAMTAALARLAPTHVFALLGTTRRRALRDASSTYERVDYGLTALLLRAAARGGSRPRFVYLSAAGVTPGARSAYYRARARVEDELRASGLPFTIARPSFITGSGRDEPRPLERAGAALADGALAVAAWLGARRLRARWRSTTPDALALALVRLALDPAAEGAVVESERLREA